jgi:hypothetical protein
MHGYGVYIPFYGEKWVFNFKFVYERLSLTLNVFYCIVNSEIYNEKYR